MSMVSMVQLWYNYLGKLQSFTKLNLAAIKGDDFPKINHGSQGSVIVRSL